MYAIVFVIPCFIENISPVNPCCNLRHWHGYKSRYESFNLAAEFQWDSAVCSVLGHFHNLMMNSVRSSNFKLHVSRNIFRHKTF